MQFFHLDDAYSVSRFARAGISVDECYSRLIDDAGNQYILKTKNYVGQEALQDASNVVLQLRSEWLWWTNGRPYYNVWPAMVDTLTTFDVTHVPLASFFAAPDPHIAIQFSVDNSRQVLGMLVSVLRNVPTEAGVRDVILFSRHTVERQIVECSGRMIHAVYCDMLAVLPGKQTYSLAEVGAYYNERPENRWLRNIALAVLLMERTPSLFEPDILRCDCERYDRASTDVRKRLEERAFKRRGQRGYHVGRQLETIPHYRRPHPALYWTGKGRRIATVVFRSGCIVKRQAMTTAPTGRLGSYGESERDK